MKKLSNFTVFFILLITTIASVLLIYLDIVSIIDYAKATTEIDQSVNLIFILKYSAGLMGVLVGGFALSTILYQLIRIGNHTEQKQNDKENENSQL